LIELIVDKSAFTALLHPHQGFCSACIARKKQEKAKEDRKRKKKTLREQRKKDTEIINDHNQGMAAFVQGGFWPPQS